MNPLSEVLDAAAAAVDFFDGLRTPLDWILFSHELTAALVGRLMDPWG